MLDHLLINEGGGITAHGSVASRLLAGGMNPSALRTLDVLRKEEWLQYDDRVIEVARQRLRGVGDLMMRGLTFDIQNALGTTQVQWEVMSDMSPANVSMSGVTEGERDRVTFQLKTLPLPIIHKDFYVNIRALEASRSLGQSLDVTQAELATRLVAEEIEDMLFNGEPNLTVGGVTIEGYTTATNRNTGSLGGDWNSRTGQQILDDVQAMKNAARADNMFGPYVLYVPKTFGTALDEDFKAESDRTIRERLLALPDIDAIFESDDLADGASGEVILVQMTRDVVDVVDGMQPTTVMWEVQGGMQVNFKVMAIIIPRMKSTITSQSGIQHYSV